MKEKKGSAFTDIKFNGKPEVEARRNGFRLTKGKIAGAGLGAILLATGTFGREPIGNLWMSSFGDSKPASAAPTDGETPVAQADRMMAEIKASVVSGSTSLAQPAAEGTPVPSNPGISVGKKDATPAAQNGITKEPFPKGKKDVLHPNCSIVGDISYRDEKGDLVFAPGESNANLGTIFETNKDVDVEGTNEAEKVCADSHDAIVKYDEQRALEMQQPGMGCGMANGCSDGTNIVGPDGSRRLVKAGKDGAQIIPSGKGDGGVEVSPTASPTTTPSKEGKVVEICQGQEVTIKCVACESPTATGTPASQKGAECPATDFEVPKKRLDAKEEFPKKNIARIQKGDIVLGDGAFRRNPTEDFVPYYDNDGETGLRVIVDADGEAFSEWGIDVFRPCPVDQNPEANKQQVDDHLGRTVVEMFNDGCDTTDGDGCNMVIDKEFPGNNVVNTQTRR